MLIKNEYYKELSVIPELLLRERYDEATYICRQVIKKNIKYYSSWNIYSLTCLYRAISDININNNEFRLVIGLSNKIALLYYHRINEIDIEEIYDLGRIFQIHKKYYDICVTELVEQRFKNIDIEKDKKLILSGLYGALAQVTADTKKYDQNIDEAYRAIKLDKFNEFAYESLYDTYAIIKCEEKIINVLNDWASVSATPISPYIRLCEIYEENKTWDKAGLLYYYIAKNYQNKGDQVKKLIGNDIFRKLLFMPQIMAQMLYSNYSWKEGKYYKSIQHLVKSYAMQRSYKNKTDVSLNYIYQIKSLKDYEKEINSNTGTNYWLILKTLHLDKKIKYLGDNNINTLYTLYDYVSEIEEQVSAIYKIHNLIHLNDMLFDELMNVDLMFTSKRLYISLIYAALNKYVKSDWSIKVYLHNVMCQTHEYHKKNQENEYEVIINNIIEKINLLGDNNNELMNVNRDICALIKNIFNNIGFVQTKVSINMLDDFIIEYYGCKSRGDVHKKEMYLIKLLTNNLHFIDGELSCIWKWEKRLESSINSQLVNLKKEIKDQLYQIPKQTAQVVIEKQKEEQSEKKDKITLKIDFTKAKQIEVNGNPYKIKRTREFLLLEELLNNKDKEIHWSYGFVLFKGWQNVEKLPADPRDQFKNIVSLINGYLGREAIESQQQDIYKVWRLKDDINIVYNSIEKSQRLCNQANNAKNINAAVNKIQEALTFYPESIEANICLIDLLAKYQDNESIGGNTKCNLITAIDCIRRRESSLTMAINILQTIGEKSNWEGDWKEVPYYIIKMTDELKRLQSVVVLIEERVEKKLILSQDELECLSLVRLINKMKKFSINVQERDYRMKTLIKDKNIKQCIEIAKNDVKKNVRERGYSEIIFKDIDYTAQYSFVWFVSKKGDISFKDIGKLKFYITESLKYQILENSINDAYSINSSDQREMREMFKARKLLREKLGRDPDTREIIVELSGAWDWAKMDKAKANEAIIKRNIEFTEEWYCSLSDSFFIDGKNQL